MGLFDGASGRGELASTAHVAKLLDAPVVLVVDAAAMARSAAADRPRLSHVRPRRERRGRDLQQGRLRSRTSSCCARRVAGRRRPGPRCAPRRDERIVAPERHLGLVPAAEREAPHAGRPRRAGRRRDRTPDRPRRRSSALARAAPDLDAATAWSPEPRDGEPASPARIAIARGPAFSFHYEENLELLEAAGAELVAFDPTPRRVAARRCRRARARRRLPGDLRSRARGQRVAAGRRWPRSPRRDGRCSPSAADSSTSARRSTATRCAACCRPRAPDGRAPDPRLPRGDRGDGDPVARRRRRPCAARVPLLERSTRRTARRSAWSLSAARHARGRRASSPAPSRRATCTSTGPRIPSVARGSPRAAARPVAA